jgi:hypothetical protein
LEWLFSLQVDPFAVSILTLVTTPIIVANKAAKPDVRRATLIPFAVGLGAMLFLYAPSFLPQSLGVNFTTLSFGVKSTSAYAQGNTILSALGIETATLWAEVHWTGTTQK